MRVFPLVTTGLLLALLSTEARGVTLAPGDILVSRPGEIDVYSPDGQAALGSFTGGLLSHPSYMTFDGSGNLIVADTTGLIRISPTGAQTPLAAGAFGAALGVALDPTDGSFVVLDPGTNQVRRVGTNGTTTSTIASYSLGAYDHDVAVAGNGDIFFTAPTGVVEIDHADATHTPRTIAAGGDLDRFLPSGARDTADENGIPDDLRVLANGHILVLTEDGGSWPGNGTLVDVDPTVAGPTANQTLLFAFQAGFTGTPTYDPTGLAIAADGSYLIADATRGALVRLSGDLSAVTTLDGNLPGALAVAVVPAPEPSGTCLALVAGGAAALARRSPRRVSP